jgi:hypothetical protein
MMSRTAGSPGPPDRSAHKRTSPEVMNFSSVRLTTRNLANSFPDFNR